MSAEVRAAVLRVAAIVALYLAVGLVAGVVWEWLWSPPTQVVEQHQVFYTDYGSLRRVFTGTGLYVLVAAVASLVLGLVVGLLTRRQELVVLGAVLVGSLVAALAMHAVGVALGPPDPTHLARTAADGTHVSAQLVVHGKSPFLVWPMTSLFVLALVFFGWSSHLPGGAHAQTAPETAPDAAPGAASGAASDAADAAPAG